jgi:hypothetical protein
MQRLHSTVQHLGKSRQLADVFDFQASITQRFRGSTSRNQLDSMVSQCAGELNKAGLIGNGKKSAANRTKIYRNSGRSTM